MLEDVITFVQVNSSQSEYHIHSHVRKFHSRPYSTENTGTVFARRLPDHTCQKFSLTFSETIATRKAQAR